MTKPAAPVDIEQLQEAAKKVSDHHLGVQSVQNSLSLSREPDQN